MVIQERKKATHGRKKSYVYRRHRSLKFVLGEWVFLKVSPTKGISRFDIAGKLNPRYIRPYPIIQRVGEEAYWLGLPPELLIVHNIFHVSQLRKYLPDPSHVIEPDLVQLKEDLSYEDQPIQILNVGKTTPSKK